MIDVIRARLAGIGERLLLEILPRQQFAAMKDDLVIFGMVAAFVVALWLVPPILEVEQTRLMSRISARLSSGLSR